MDELQKLFEELPGLNGMELMDRLREATQAKLVAQAQAEIIKNALEWREISRQQRNPNV